MNEQSTYISCFFFFLFSFLLLVCSCFLFSFFFLLLLFFQHVALFSSFLSAPIRSSYCWWFVLVFISFYFFQFQHFSLSLFVDVLWCLKLSFTVTRFVLNPWRTLLAQAPNRTMLYTHLLHHDTTIIKTDAHRKTHEDFFNNILPLTLFVRFEKGYSRLHVRGCWRPNINFIFRSHCYDRHVVSFLFSWCWGPLHRGFSDDPLGRVWPSLPHLVSTVWKSAGNYFGTQLNSII